jgi:hypothetical protein
MLFFDPFPDLVPDDNHDVFRGWDQVFELWAVEVQVFVVERLLDFFGDDLAEFLDVDDIAGFGTDGAGNADDELVIVPVEIRAVAFPEHRFVLLKRPVLAVQAVRGIEMRPSADGDFTHVLYFFGFVNLDFWLKVYVLQDSDKIRRK